MKLRLFLAGGLVCCGTMPGWQASDSGSTPARTDRPAEIKTQTYKGTLVDAGCAMSGSSHMSSASAASSSSSSQSSSSDATAGTEKKPDAGGGSADRAAAGGSCAVSSSTSRFALKMEDGRTVPFDSVGNDRAQEALKNKKKWTEAAQAGKPVKVKVSGAMTGDRLTVLSVN